MQFMYPAKTAWDAPNAPFGLINSGVIAVGNAVGAGDRGTVVQAAEDPASSYGAVAIPPPDVINVRGGAEGPKTSLVPVAPETGIGSNNWAVGGQYTVTGAPRVSLTVKTGPGGVLYREDSDGCWFVSWLAQQPPATNINLMGLERA